MYARWDNWFKNAAIALAPRAKVSHHWAWVEKKIYAGRVVDALLALSAKAGAMGIKIEVSLPPTTRLSTDAPSGAP